MIKVIEYAVRVKGTQKYLPRSQRRDGRGGSHLEPVDFSLPPGERLDSKSHRYESELQIRSYATRTAAENLARSWVQGKFYQDNDGYSWNKQVPERNIKNLEIVEITISLPPI